MNNQENMNKDDKFEQKLKMLVEKYGKRTKKSKKHSNQSHFFNYEKVKKNVLLADKDDKYIYAINIYDDEFVDILKDIYTDPNLFDDEPSTTTDGLYYSINIIRKKYIESRIIKSVLLNAKKFLPNILAINFFVHL